ncbi:MAG TPA: galactose-1-phosphate uridylyltransferase [Candidatus Nitrosocosmicus sp.]|nr:galactose-1-phosphate uridylyltransferase [Candidatus Nitrosocosmicus sp.]
MSELRKDYYVPDKYVLIPNNIDQFDKFPEMVHKKQQSDIVSDSINCPYCPHSSKECDNLVLSFVVKEGILQRLYDTTEDENENWTIRVFECKHPIVSSTSSHQYSDRPFYREPACGYDLIVVPTPKHDVALSELSVDEWTNLLLVLQDRVRWLYSQRGVTYVAIYASRGLDNGTSIRHPHFHITTFSAIPPIIEKEAKTFHQSMNESGSCPACDMIENETNGPRQLFSTSGFITLVPWAPTYNYEFWICPRKHSTFFSKVTQKEIKDLALVVCSSLRGMDKTLGQADFSIAFHISPEKKNSRQLHWHLEIYPLVTSWSGLERGFGIFVNMPTPEDSARLLGDATRKELARLIGVL